MIKALFPLDIDTALRGLVGIPPEEVQLVRDALNRYITGGVSPFELDRALSELKFGGKISGNNLVTITQKLKSVLDQKNP